MQRKCQELLRWRRRRGGPSYLQAPGVPQALRTVKRGDGGSLGRAVPIAPRHGPAFLLTAAPHRRGPPLVGFGASFASWQASASPAGFSPWHGQASHTLSYMSMCIFIYTYVNKICIYVCIYTHTCTWMFLFWLEKRITKNSRWNMEWVQPCLRVSLSTWKKVTPHKNTCICVRLLFKTIPHIWLKLNMPPCIFKIKALFWKAYNPFKEILLI